MSCLTAKKKYHNLGADFRFAVYLTNVFSSMKAGHIFIKELHFCSLNLKVEIMCQKWWVVVCHADPCAKSVQYLDLLNTLIFLKIFSTGDILTLVDHTLIDHTACITLNLFVVVYQPNGLSCPEFLSPWKKTRYWLGDLNVYKEMYKINMS